MKFRGLIAEQNAMKEFMNIANSLPKLSKECVLRILSDKIYFIVTEEEHGPRRPFVWCELNAIYYFKEYNMSGVSNDANEIYLSFSPTMFARPVTTIKQGAKFLKIKLTDKQTPCLTLEIDMAPNLAAGSRQCVHDIPVEVIPRKYWSDYKEPTYEEFHVSLQLPSIKPLRNIVERMKNMSTYLIVSAGKDGRMTLKIESSLVNISAHFHNLIVQSFVDGLDNDDDFEMTYIGDNEEKSLFVKVSVDIRKLYAFLTAVNIVNNTVNCSIVNEKMLKLSIENADYMNLQCFLTEYSSI